MVIDAYIQMHFVYTRETRTLRARSIHRFQFFTMKTFLRLFVTCAMLFNVIQVEALTCAAPKCDGILCSPPKCSPPDSLQTDPCHCCPYCAEEPLV
ncbi:unnamed protein product [Acanthoscelides obtectus]|uniref:Uncharacterized protein n=1 Tax=Acanthoscelides obtectus TaxID=200917 RepID=A0A9P0K7J7_ACAOB|nr:unnamed protein product [Acanthoscelides obtectus]CAK1667409.1 hypothetical protein AOBTE_LOCUS25819 [Acanthoscelides obtectus]